MQEASREERQKEQQRNRNLAREDKPEIYRETDSEGGKQDEEKGEERREGKEKKRKKEKKR